MSAEEERSAEHGGRNAQKKNKALSYLRAPSRIRKRPWEGSRRGCTRRDRPGPRRGSLLSGRCRGEGGSE